MNIFFIYNEILLSKHFILNLLTTVAYLHSWGIRDMHLFLPSSLSPRMTALLRLSEATSEAGELSYTTNAEREWEMWAHSLNSGGLCLQITTLSYLHRQCTRRGWSKEREGVAEASVLRAVALVPLFSHNSWTIYWGWWFKYAIGLGRCHCANKSIYFARHTTLLLNK